MKRLLFIVALLITSITTSKAQPGDFSLPLLNGGGTVSLSQFKGKVVIVDFWASWCGPCQESFKFYNELLSNSAYKDKVVIIGINEDKETNLAKDFVKNHPVSFTLAADSQSVTGDKQTGATAKQFGVGNMPTAYLFDKTGTFRKEFRGFRKGESDKELENEIKELLK